MSIVENDNEFLPLEEQMQAVSFNEAEDDDFDQLIEDIENQNFPMIDDFRPLGGSLVQKRKGRKDRKKADFEQNKGPKVSILDMD